MASSPLSSLLLGSFDPQRLRQWYLDALAPPETHNGFLDFGGVEILIDGRADLAASAAEPGRFILNFHVEARDALRTLGAAPLPLPRRLPASRCRRSRPHLATQP